jgi:hypothetical protein
MATADDPVDPEEALRQKILKQQQDEAPAAEPTTTAAAPIPAAAFAAPGQAVDPGETPGYRQERQDIVAAIPQPAALPVAAEAAPAASTARTTPYDPNAGFDTTRTNDPNDHEIKYEYQRYAQDHPGLVGQALRDAFAGDAAVKARFPGIQTQGQDLLRANASDPWQDVVGDVGGQNRLQFQNADGSGSGAATGSASAAGAASAAGGATSAAGMTQGAFSPTSLHPGTGSTEAEWATSKMLSGEWTSQQVNAYLAGGGTGTGAGAPSDFQAQARQLLLDRIKAAGLPVDENSPGITDAVTAARDEGTRQSELERSALAERMYAQGGGLNTDAMGMKIQQSAEKQAMNVGGLRATLIMKEVDARRTELDQLLQMATASGDAENARQVQMAIAELDAMVRREGLDVDRDRLNLDAGKATLDDQFRYAQLYGGGA